MTRLLNTPQTWATTDMLSLIHPSSLQNSCIFTQHRVCTVLRHPLVYLEYLLHLTRLSIGIKHSLINLKNPQHAFLQRGSKAVGPMS